jgi:hypothetical protein
MIDPRYNEFENHTRSCADIDRHLAGFTHEKITVSKVLIKSVFDILVEGARKELPVSTPYNLQFVRCAEYRFLEQALASTTRMMDGMKVQSRTLFGAIMTELLNTAAATFKTSGLVPTLVQVELDKWANEQVAAAKAIMRPGFYSCAKKMVSRTLEFVRLRKCSCTNGGFGEGFHNHGGRVYYNPEAANWFRRQ